MVVGVAGETGRLGLIDDAKRMEALALVRTGRMYDLGRVLHCFPRTVEVPPLRHHIEDMRELVPFMISKLTKGGSLSCSAAADIAPTNR